MLTKEFVTAGRALFTVETPESHYTFKVTKKEATEQYSEAFFVQMLTGPENTSDYTYIGMLNPNSGEVRLTKKSKMTKETFAFRLLNRMLNRVWQDAHEDYQKHGYDIRHSGKCGKCGRTLTVPASLDSGIGPECAKNMGLTF